MTATESLASLEKAIASAPTSPNSPSLRLTDALLPAPIAETLAVALVDDGPLVLDSAKALNGDKVPRGVGGDATLLGWPGLAVQLTYPSDSALRLGATAPAGRLKQAGLDWIEWTDLRLSLDVSAGGEVQASEITGKLGGGAIPMTGALAADPAGAPCWVATSAKNGANLPKLVDLFPARGPNALLDAVQPLLGTVLNHQVNGVRVLLQPSDWGARSTLTLQTASSWQPFDGAPSIEQLALTFGGGGQSIDISVAGTFRLNRAMGLPVSESRWRVRSMPPGD